MKDFHKRPNVADKCGWTQCERGCDDKAAQTVVIYTFSAQQQKQMKG